MKRGDIQTILILGATGTIGGETARRALARGFDVRAGVRSADKARGLADAGAELVEIDLTRPDTLDAAFQGVDGVFVVVPFVEDMVAQERAALDAARRQGVKLVVKLSGAGASAEAPVFVTRAHGEGERALVASGLSHAILRPAFYQDNFLTFQLDTIRSQGAVYGASAGGKTAYVSSRDVADAALAVFEHPAPHLGKVFELTGPEAIDDARVAALLSEAAGRPIRYVDVGPAGLAESMKDAPGWLRESMLFLESVKAQGWAAQVGPDLERLLGRPGERFEDFLRRRAAALR